VLVKKHIAQHAGASQLPPLDDANVPHDQFPTDISSLNHVPPQFPVPQCLSFSSSSRQAILARILVP
jgi:hypothetical protein